MAKYVAFNPMLNASSKMYRSQVEAEITANRLNSQLTENQGDYFPVRITSRMPPEQCAAGSRAAIADELQTQPPVWNQYNNDDLYA